MKQIYTATRQSESVLSVMPALPECCAAVQRCDATAQNVGCSSVVRAFRRPARNGVPRSFMGNACFPFDFVVRVQAGGRSGLDVSPRFTALLARWNPVSGLARLGAWARARLPNGASSIRPFGAPLHRALQPLPDPYWGGLFRLSWPSCARDMKGRSSPWVESRPHNPPQNTQYPRYTPFCVFCVEGFTS